MGEMRERPIIFSAPMVRAILEGRKTQTRRIAKAPRANRPSLLDVEPDGRPTWSDSYITDPGNVEWLWRDCPYGAPGDQLWVRETWKPVPATAYRCSTGVQQTINPSDRDEAAIYAEGWERSIPRPWKSPIHMPRWASRITLELTEVRVERLQEISEADAIAEGCGAFGPYPGEETDVPTGGAVEAFQELWDRINGPASWEANPWVWAVSFKQALPRPIHEPRP